jgi:chorismate mutase/prephenate dehydratase
MYSNARLSYVSSWQEVMEALKSKTADYGVLPVENSTAGSVIDVYDLLLKYKYSIVKALKLPVSHCLLGVHGAKVSDIDEVYSHPHAFPQCKPFFEKNSGIKKVNSHNTALAAKTVSELGDKKKAAIASKECAAIYGLDVIAESVQQTEDNCTRFVSVAVSPESHENADKISLILSFPHKTGSLYRLLSRFSLNGLNLTKIESRPDPKTPFEYYFYVDFLGSVACEKTLNLLLALKEELVSVYYLGNYQEIDENR